MKQDMWKQKQMCHILQKSISTMKMGTKANITLIITQLISINKLRYSLLYNISM